MTKSHVRLRLQRTGVRNHPSYRIVAINIRTKRDGIFHELLGKYNPIPDKEGNKMLHIKQDRILHWLAVGAEPTDRVAWLLSKAGILPPLPFPVNKTKGLQPRKWQAAKIQEEIEKKKKRDEAKAAEEEKARAEAEKVEKKE